MLIAVKTSNPWVNAGLAPQGSPPGPRREAYPGPQREAAGPAVGKGFSGA